MILEGVAIGLGRYPVQRGRTIGKTRTFAVVLVDTRTEKWIYSEGRYRGGKRVKVQCSPDFRVEGQRVKIRVPDTFGPEFERVSEQDPNSEGVSRIKFVPHIVED